MPHDYDQGLAALDDLIEWAEANASGRSRNEATTRLHLIDALLTRVLRWPRAAMTAEEPAGSGRIDYAIGTPAIQFIVEAKREGVYFDLPAGTKLGVHSIESLTSGSAGKPLREAMEQVAEYAFRRGVAPVGVTNGNQFVLFIGARNDQVPPMKGKALVFPSLTDMRSDYRLLWDNASPVGIDERTIYRTLRLTEAPPPEPLARHLTNYPGVKRRNDLQAGLDILGELFLEDVARLEDLRDEFLRDCYASSGALSQYAEISKQILQTRYALLGAEDGPQLATLVGKKRLNPALTQDMLAAAASRRPIVLLGDVGVGKTTFIQRLVHVDAAEIFAHALSLYIDFGASITLGQLSAFVIDESKRQLYSQYEIDIEDASFVEAVYHGALNRFEKSVAGKLKNVDVVAYEMARIRFLQDKVDNGSEHLRASLEHLRSNQHRQLIVFLDNIDQRSSEDQEQVFLIANELAQTWPATVFVTLRPETFYQSSRKGTLSGYQARVFTISPPRADVMLQRRVDFALKQLNETRRLGSYPTGITVDSESLVAFLEVLASNFRENQELLALIENLAGGNMRLALKFVADFIGSGHIDTRKIVTLQEASGSYKIPLHEFLRALLYGDAVYYDPDSSPIANVFRITQPDGREHFLLALVLSQLQALGERGSEEGYVATGELYTFAQQLGFNAEQIATALGHAAEHRLCEVSPRYSGDQVRSYYRITTVGAYTVRILMSYFAYVDAVVTDTSIIDEGYRTVISDAHTLADRLARSEYFRLYLDRQWAKMPNSQLPWRWSDVSRKLSQDIYKVGRRTDPGTWGANPAP